jgi:uncharacterized protein YjbJ (UPF0337 family)
MITRQELEGNWNTVKGKLQEKWGQLTDNDLTQFKGDANQLIGAIQAKTGETRRAVEEFLQSSMKNSGTAVQHAVENAKEYATQARDMAAERLQQAKDGVQAGMQEAEQMVKRSPMESVAVAFGAGMIAGVITGLILKSSRA